MRIEIEYQGHLYFADAQIVKGKTWIHFQGRTWCLEAEKKKFGKSAQAKSSSGEITAPMPGKVTKLLKTVGDSVSSGEAVLVMEAMKMEYTLKADISGIINAVTCQVGDQVSLGKALAKIEPKVSNEKG